MKGDMGLLVTRLRDEYLPGVPVDVSNKVFAKAWEDGHANGEHEVEIHYEELAAVVKAAYEAGKVAV